MSTPKGNLALIDPDELANMKAELRMHRNYNIVSMEQIETLTAERDRLREALRAIEDMATEFHTAEMKPVADRARAALAAKEPRDE